VRDVVCALHLAAWVKVGDDETPRGAGMPAGDVETFHKDDKWHNRIEGSQGTVGTYDTKERAVEEGRDLARSSRVEHIVRNLDGTIGERSTYGHDPRDIPG
jgi:hypothetical protein